MGDLVLYRKTNQVEKAMARSKNDMKKVDRKADEGLGQRKVRYGKQPHQKMKPYLVYDYLLRQTDENNTRSAYDIAGYLEEEFGINADRRSLYTDIAEINLVLYALENECSMEDAEEEFKAAEEADELAEYQTIVYDKKRKGFYVQQRKYDLNDIRLLAECVYSARFLTQGQSDRLANAITEFVSEHQKDQITHNAFLVGRVRTSNKSVMNNISIINEAMRKGTKDSPHVKHKISFKYLKYSINDVSKQAERRQGQKYVVSPFQLLINDGNYYLLAYSDKFQEMRTYRLDRMKDVEELNEPREGEDEFLAMDMDTFTQRTFGMFGGDRKGITLRFINPLLDTVIDRFGTKGLRYAKADEGHFRVELEVEISDQFFGWLMGFGNKVKIMGPDSAINAFREYLDKVRCMY